MRVMSENCLVGTPRKVVITSYSIHYTKLYEFAAQDGSASHLHDLGLQGQDEAARLVESGFPGSYNFV